MHEKGERSVNVTVSSLALIHSLVLYHSGIIPITCSIIYHKATSY